MFKGPIQEENITILSTQAPNLGVPENIKQMVIAICCSAISHVQLFATPWTAALKASLSVAISRGLLKFMFIESVMLSNYLLCHPLLLMASIIPRNRIFYSESILCIMLPKYWSFHLSISPSNEYSGLISFRID